MSVVQLAAETDVKAALGRDLTTDEKARVGAILDKASELFRLESGQQFTAGSSTSRVKVNGGRAVLRQAPVVEVTSVVDDLGNHVPFTLFKQTLTVPKRSHEFVIVEYSHGGAVPDLVRLTVADVARQVLQIDPKAARGMSAAMEVTGPFTDQHTYAVWAQGGATRLAPADVAVARSFRVKVPNVWVS